MALGLIVSSSIPRAFESRGLAFAGAYAAMQVGRSAFFVWAARKDGEEDRALQKRLGIRRKTRLGR